MGQARRGAAGDYVLGEITAVPKSTVVDTRYPMEFAKHVLLFWMVAVLKIQETEGGEAEKDQKPGRCAAHQCIAIGGGLAF
jgi:hypothetical protein